MKIAIDISPLYSGHYLQHRVRGTGFYLRNLKDSLLKYYPNEEFSFVNRGEGISRDVDLAHYPYFEPFFITLPLLKRKKTVVTVHDLTPLVFKDKFPSGIKGALKWRIQKRSLRKADAIIADSQSSKKDIEKHADIEPTKIHVVYLAAASLFKQTKITKKTINEIVLPEKFALYVGDATWNKNLPGLVRAVNETQYSLVIAGAAFKNKDFDINNPWNTGLKEAQELASKNKRIIPLGFVEDEDLVALYNCATVAIMPSFYEGFGLPVLEAMQSGCPVITSKEGSLYEIGGEAVYYIDPYSVDSIKESLVEVLSSSELREKLSKKGLEQAKKFSWEKTASETMEVYEKLYKQNNR